MTAAQQSRLMKRLRETYDWCLGLAWGNALEMHMENHAHGFEKSAISHTLEKATDTKEYHSSK